MRLVLVRHGDAHAGFQGLVPGRRGCGGLTDLGRSQAQALHDYLRGHLRLKADALLASTLPRAIETAQFIAPALGFETLEQHCDLCEVHTGEADGLEWGEYGTRYGTFVMQDEPDRLFAPEGESWNGFHGRVQSMLERVAREYKGKTVVAVCHAGVIMASMRLLLGLPQPGTHGELRPSNTGLTEWEHDDETHVWTLRSFNETPHLVAPAHPYSVETARLAAGRGGLGDWVAEFLASPGSDNAALGTQLTESKRHWLGPVRLPIERLHRTAGPPGHPVLRTVEEGDWRGDVEEMAAVVDTSELPPIVVTFRAGLLLVEDGNHRVEALREAGALETWAVVGFDTDEDRDRFLQARQ